MLSLPFSGLVPKRLFSIVFGSAGALITVILWGLLAPQQLGGRISFVLINGNSMLPNYVTNDLVVIQHEDNYAVGDVVAYRHAEIGTVFHRIVSLEDGAFVLQGDNNSFLDSFRPNSSDIIGIEWLHLPRIGSLLTQIRSSPLLIALLATCAIIFVFFDDFRSHIQSRPRPMQSSERAKMFINNRYRDEWLSFLLFIAALMLVGMYIAYQHPLYTTSQQPMPYEQKMTLTYSAVAMPGVFDATITAAGEPIFRQLSDAMIVGARYQLEADLPTELAGSYSLHAELSDTSGWKRTIELVSNTAFEGNSAEIFATLSFNQLQSILDTLWAETGVERSQYQLRIIPAVQIAGNIAGHQIDSNMREHITFDMSELELRARTDPTLEGQGLIKRRSGNIEQSVTQLNQFGLFGFSMPIETMRRVTTIGLAVTLASLLFTYFYLLRTSASPIGQQRQMQEQLLIAVENDPLNLSTSRVRLKDADDLLRIAMQSNKMILQHPQRLAVFDGNVVYYTVQSEGDAPAMPLEATSLEAIA